MLVDDVGARDAFSAATTVLASIVLARSMLATTAAASNGPVVERHTRAQLQFQVQPVGANSHDSAARFEIAVGVDTVSRFEDG
ncbi:hypothetical protein GS474_10595 [Rhodococcus hoagii]|nr:hypothetical protein [Prescottella equi]